MKSFGSMLKFRETERENHMNIFYFLYALLVGLWVLFDAPLHDKSRWWALGVFVLPLITPYYFVKTRPMGKYWKYIGLWILGFFIFHALSVVFRSR
jgi:hypothetical protein